MQNISEKTTLETLVLVLQRDCEKVRQLRTETPSELDLIQPLGVQTVVEPGGACVQTASPASSGADQGDGDSVEKSRS